MKTPPPVGKPAAKQGDAIAGTDVHILMVPSPGGPVATPTPMPFAGQIDEGVVDDVVCEGRPVATQGSKATNTPAHVPAAGPFQKPPSNQATIQTASETVFAAGKALARAGDTAFTCNDPEDLPNGTVIAASTVMVG